MPFIRTGLCATDQVKCANMLGAGRDPREVAAKLHTSVDIAKQFTLETLAKNKEKNKKIAANSVKHAKDVKSTAAALAGAAKTILSQVPDVTTEFD